MNEIKIKRAYEAAEDSDGIRVLVDRMWPRGISKDRLKTEEWIKELAPSAELRKWFDHDSDKYDDFCRKYWNELEVNEEANHFCAKCKEWLKDRNVTFVFAAKNLDCNNAVALKMWVEDNIRSECC